jgi:hypothetical protein
MTTHSSATTKPLCFVIGPISKDGSVERRHADLLLHTVVKHVLEADEFGYQVRRADEDADPGMIGDRMVSDIIHADLVVADLTDLNPNAFYELGIRHSTEKPTIHVAKTGTVLPFDNVAHRTVFVDLTDWGSTEIARTQLAASARAIKAPGYRVSNPITQANASFKMRESADPRDRLLVGLQERLSSIELQLSELGLSGGLTRQRAGIDLRQLLAFARGLQNSDRELSPQKVLGILASKAEGAGLNPKVAMLPRGWRLEFPGTDEAIAMIDGQVVIDDALAR